MDRNVVTATVLIAIIMFVWLWWLAPPPPDPNAVPVAPADTQTVAEEPVAPEARPGIPGAVDPAPVPSDSTIAGAQEGEGRIITVVTERYTARFSTKGATPVQFELQNYKKFDQTTPVQIVDTTQAGALGLIFTTPTNHIVDTRHFVFETAAADTLFVEDEAEALIFETRVGQGTIRKAYTFEPSEYEVGLRIEQENASTFSTQEGYELAWYGGVPFAEGNPEDEAMRAGAYARSGGEVEGINLMGEAYEEQVLRGEVSWTAVKNKYFAAIAMPQGETRGAELIGERAGEPGGLRYDETYVTTLALPPAQGAGDEFLLYLGPMEFFRITDYNLDLYSMVDYGYDIFEWITRPLAKFIFIPAFTFLGRFIDNYGLVIIVFSLILKTLLYPLTKSSYKSMARMRELQPKLVALKEQYPDNPQKQQEQMMKIYRETGVNPLGGCLPMLLQWPIIIALYQYLQQSIEIRQEGFLWATDLSAPDVLLNLPFGIPFYGDYVSGFTLLMALSLVVQMRIQGTVATAGPQAKVLMYVMPAFLLFIFNRLPSGLSLYYLCYNVVSAVQQQLINRSIKAQDAGSDGSDQPAASKKPAKTDGKGNGRGGTRKKKGKQVRT